jgi:D-ribose pyranase
MTVAGLGDIGRGRWEDAFEHTGSIYPCPGQGCPLFVVTETANVAVRMLRSGILNPHLNALLARFRHTNTLVIADRGFPFWPQIETIDLSLVDGLPTVKQVVFAIVQSCSIGQAWMAEEFRRQNGVNAVAAYRQIPGLTGLAFEPHDDFKKRVLGSIGLVRTGDTIPYANIILESA